MSFHEELLRKTKDAEEILQSYLPKQADCPYQQTVADAMSYSAMAGGKRLRPVLMKECYLLFGGKGQLVEPFMAALEMIHNYSLVHDDLPAMDNDEYRRGKKTTWKVYGECMAILAGDGLLNLAFETAAEAFTVLEKESFGTPEEELLRYKAVGRAMQILGQKSGVYGMLGGQTADIEAEEKEELTEELLLFIHEHKTAALMESAMMIGAVLAGASEADLKKLERAASDLGIAFQIQDDILDCISTTEVLGKPVGSDEKNHKLTYVTLHGLEESKAQVRELSEEAIQILNSFPQKNEFLIQLVEQLVNREK